MNLNLLSIALIAALPSFAGEGTNDPLALYKSGDYAHALPLLRQGITASPKDAALQAALLSVLVYQDNVDESLKLADRDAQEFAQSPEVLVARGEFAFHMGDISQAESLFKAALKLNDQNARAYYGLYRVNLAASMYRNARLFCFRAHGIDPDDALITYEFMDYLTAEKRKELLPPFKESHPWLYGQEDKEQKNGSDVDREINGRKLFDTDGPLQEMTLPIHYLQNGQEVRGIGVDMSINGSKPLRVMLDTGASGLILKQSAIDKAELNHVGSYELHGIGDQGSKHAFLAVADTCSIEGLKLKTCVVQGTEGKERIAGEEDGLMGADLFDNYLITIDFQQRTMHLVPLPERKPSAQGYNREPLPSEAEFTPVFRFGHHLYVATKVNGKANGLFLIDTGAGISAIDTTFARLTTKIHGNDLLLRGVSGKVKTVSEADKADLEFGRFRQSNSELTAFELNSHAGSGGVRMSGILGFQILMFFRLSIDYRNGLINFDYVPDHFFKAK